MKILIFGIGGVGGYFGGKLAQAGFNVTMIARGKHLEEIKENGLEVESINGDFTVQPNLATDNLAEVPTPDLVILGVKSWQIQEVANKLKPIISPETMILPLQNGANNVEKLLEILPKRNILAGLCHIVSFVEKPGKIKHVSFEPRITFGEIDNSNSERIQRLKTVFGKAEITNFNPENIQLEIWKKFLFITTISGLGGLTRVSIDKIRESKYLYDLLLKTAQEIKLIANAKDIPLAEEHLEKAFEIIQNQPPGTTASTQRDIMAGRPSELENFNGFIVKEAEKLGIATPVNKMIYECLLPMEKEARNS
ncbi:ketopantoate reductase family protein [Salegentibacter salarius]|uniref:2-dehydropantoate 2-reductase n=1 Tax=Salegentibacter salarius TaxID=435906 RepID=A0A2N0TZE2_9FLAO|nr:2-dehydropantoate 2-reductase [Salegentibacter salarius]OEY73295.1 2-dehydropantoate 2-reductase [Salegentibacter salarius]PKD20115.1 2-dehydropantoate 2-reductase [Salegentibacter salarius]SLJ97827.1 2-dehydropantoate 2-reductase [Salegentibacter salarius]